MSTSEQTIDTAARLRRSVTQLHRRLRQSSPGISPAQASMLGTIDRAGRPTLGELAAIEQVQPPSVTRIVRTLHASGLVDLIKDPDDGRVMRAELTAAGRRELSGIRQRRTEFLASKLEALPRSEQERVRELVSVLEQILTSA